MAEGNRLERQGDVIRKIFASHMDYSRESNVYAKLKDTGLAPEVTMQYDGLIEHVYVDGPSFAELFGEYTGEPSKLASIFEQVCDWYEKYRKATNLILGEAAPEKFILTDKGFVYVDFEHCRPGFPESDIADVVKWMCSGSSGFDDAGVEAAKLFICVCSSKMDLKPERLEKGLRRSLGSGEDAAGIIQYMTSAGVVSAFDCGGFAFGSACAALAAAPQRCIAAPAGSGASCPGFEVIRGASLEECLTILARKTSQLRFVVYKGSPEDTEPLVVSRESVIADYYK